MKLFCKNSFGNIYREKEICKVIENKKSEAKTTEIFLYLTVSRSLKKFEKKLAKAKKKYLYLH